MQSKNPKNPPPVPLPPPATLPPGQTAPESEDSRDVRDIRESGPEDRSIVMRIWRVVSSTWLGVALMLMLAGAYGIASFVERGAQLEKTMLPGVGSVYSHWTILVLTFAALVNLLLATVKIPVTWTRAGAWCSHLGLMFLAVGSIVFWQTRTEGHLVFVRTPDGGWDVVKHFFQSTEKAAFHVYKNDFGAIYPDTIQTEFEVPEGIEPVDTDISVDGVSGGVNVKAVRIYPHAELAEEWFNDEVVLNPAVEIAVSHGTHSRKVTLCQAYRDTRTLPTSHCNVIIQTTEPPSQERIDQLNAEPAASQPSREMFAIFYTGQGEPVLLVRGPFGKLTRGAFGPGRSVETAQEGHPTRITMMRVMPNARRGYSVRQPEMLMPGRTPQAAAEITVTESGFPPIRRVLPYQAYLSGGPTSLRLRSGRVISVSFSNARRDLPEPLRITRHEFKTAPASRMPEDYICDMVIGSGFQTRKETLKLNYPIKVGKFRLHQSTWRPKPETPSDYNDPGAIILGVADRPGIWLIFVGSTALCLGFPYAFYVKPLILKAKVRRASCKNSD